MAFSAWKIVKSLLISEEGTLTPKQVEIIPAGTASTKTTVTTSQTTARTITLPDATDTLVGKATTDVLTNKSLSDSTISIVDVADNTKKILFDAGGTTGTTTTLTGAQTGNRVLTLPDATDTLIGKATADVLTNKTFDANGTGNSITNIENADIAAGAAIAYSKLASASTGQLLIGNAGTPTMTTITGDVTFNAAGASAIGANKVTLAQTATLAANTAIANATGSTATPTAVPMVTTSTASSIAMRDANKNLLTNNLIEDSTIIPTAGATTTLVVGSTWQQFFTGILTQTVTLPVTSTLVVGQSWYLVNQSTGIVTVNSSGGNLVKAIPAGGSLWVTCVLTSGTTAASWNADYGLGNATADIVTNKDIDGGTASNTSRVTLPKAATATLTGLTRKQGTLLYDTTLNKPYFDDGTNLQPIGSGGSGAKNYITNPDAENSTTGWAAYALTEAVTFTDAGDVVTLASHGLKTGDLVSFSVITSTTGISINTGYYAIVASSSTFTLASTLALAQAGTALPLTTNGTGTILKSIPMTGTGGSPSSTFTASSSSPLAGNNSFLWTKSANNRMGEGFSAAFTIDAQDKAKVMQISAKYLLSSGTFAAQTGTPGAIVPSDMVWWIYDVTNSTMIQPSSISFLSNSTTIADTFNATFQTASNSTSYRLVCHTYSVSASAYTLQLDSISVSPSTYVYGTPISDWVSWTPTGSWVTNTTYTGIKRRVGDTYEYRVKLVLAGAPTATSLTINLLETIDTTKLLTPTAGGLYSVGYSDEIDFGLAVYAGRVLYNTANSVILQHYSVSGAAISEGSPTNATAPFTWGSTDQIQMYFTVPIVGLSSSVQMSDTTDTRVVVMSAQNSIVTQAVTAAVTNINFLTTNKDTHGGWSSNQYTIPVPGDYTVSAGAYATASAVPLSVFVNAVAYTSLITNPANVLSTGTITIPNLKVGDVISFRSGVSGTIAADSQQKVSIARVSGPSAIASTESVNCRYTCGTSQSIPNNTQTTILYTTKTYDTHGAYNTATGLFTAPIAGKYMVQAKYAYVGSAVWTSGNDRELIIVKSGTTYSGFISEANAAYTGSDKSLVSFDIIDCVAGDTIRVDAYQNRGSATALIGTAAFNVLVIQRIGN